MRFPDDSHFMKLALKMARKGAGQTGSNPMVGAVIVKDGRIVGKGFHEKYGGPHAELNAIQQAKNRTKGATLYLTLEPCSSYGKTPPCTSAILKAGIKRVMIGTLDPNPIHFKRGIHILKKRGVQVEVGILEAKAQALIAPFSKWITQGIPYCFVKSAMSLDGKTATSLGESKWITSPKSRAVGHRLRASVDAIMVGINTVIKDNPELSSHQIDGKDPLRIIVDSRGKIPLNSKVLKDSSKTIVATTHKLSSSKERTLLKLGVQLIKTHSKSRVNLKELFIQLGKKRVSSVLVEGGGQLIASLFQEKLVDRILFFYAPILIGGDSAPTSFEGGGILKLKKKISIVDMKLSRIGDDLLVEGNVRYS
jgi:diaminohydroxyphosphoribosylaminopyrimidine deaminase/5-amino-6-(5-phosphoribosylamino)uracil reductase